MSVRRVRRRAGANGAVREFFLIDVDFEHADGRRERVRKVPPVQTRREAEEYERQLRRELLMTPYGWARKKQMPTFKDWFHGRYWHEWVIGRKNKASTVEGKKSVYEQHLGPVFGRLRLDEIGVGQIAAFRASLVEKGLEAKTINNVLAVLSKPLHYAYDVELLTRVPKVGLLRIERPEIVVWEFAEYARLLAAAKRERPVCHAAVCLAGEAGLRVGEVKALRWREDVDLIAGTVTVQQQMRRGVIGSPKGGTRRSIPMTAELRAALQALTVVREGLVVRDLPGSALSNENQIKNLMYRVCRLARLPERGWHVLRHSFGTHAAMFGVNPWRLQAWLGHGRIDETMRYVHVAEMHSRDLPDVIAQAEASETAQDRRVLKMLGARVRVPFEPSEIAAETKAIGDAALKAAGS